jgi:peroxiredoxin
MKNEKLAAGAKFPEITLPLVSGNTVTLGDGNNKEDRWQLVVVYRGKHCPICKRYLATLEELKAEFDVEGIDVIAISGDGLEKAAAQVDEGALTFPVAYDLSLEQMVELGLYISDPRSSAETDRPFPEPALFAIRPDNTLQIIDISNAPFARPELGAILKGLRFIREKGYPVRGTRQV